MYQVGPFHTEFCSVCYVSGNPIADATGIGIQWHPSLIASYCKYNLYCTFIKPFLLNTYAWNRAEDCAIPYSIKVYQPDPCLRYMVGFRIHLNYVQGAYLQQWRVHMAKRSMKVARYAIHISGYLLQQVCHFFFFLLGKLRRDCMFVILQSNIFLF